MKKFFTTSLISCTFLLSSCTTIEDLKRINPKGSKFEQSLFKYYTEFAEEEAKQYDWTDSQYFIGKAMKVAYGKYAPPESLKHWRIPENYKTELEQARDELLHVINAPNIKNNYPEIAAKAQFLFDCWVEQQEENWQHEDISLCKEQFFVTINQLKKIVAAKYKNYEFEDHYKITSPLIDPKNKEIEYSFQEQLNKLEKSQADRKYIPSFEMDPPLKEEKIKEYGSILSYSSKDDSE